MAGHGVGPIRPYSVVVADESTDVTARKQALRASIRRAREAMDDATAREASASIVERLIGLEELQAARVVAMYAATPEEADPSGLLRWLHERDVRTLYPRVVGDRLDLAEVSDLATLTAGFRGILEPPGVAIGPEIVDVALVPGVAFDPHGGRLGQGGGHYDRLLPLLTDRATRIGVAFSLQVVPVLPLEDHDVPMDVVVTEKAIHHRPRRIPDQGA